MFSFKPSNNRAGETGRCFLHPESPSPSTPQVRISANFHSQPQNHHLHEAFPKFPTTAQPRETHIEGLLCGSHLRSNGEHDRGEPCPQEGGT